MQVELVEDASRQGEPRDSRSVNQHVVLARRLLGVSHRCLDVAHTRDERPMRDIDAWFLAIQDEDPHAVVMVAAPAARGLERPSAGDDRAGGPDLGRRLGR